MIKQILYVSDATPVMNAAEWRRIEDSSSIYNALNQITGLCCYDGSGFMQLIEGPSEKADHLLERIKRDHCHANIDVMHEGEAAHAHYGEWAMRFCSFAPNGDRRSEVERLLAPSLSPQLKAMILDWAESG